MSDAKITINGKNLTDIQTATLVTALRSFSFQLQDQKFSHALGELEAISHQLYLDEILSLIES